MEKTYYVTTPIYYVNANPHLGHAYTTILADVLSGFYRRDGYDVRFQTGTDEHGEKIAQAAAAAGVSPQSFVDDVSARFSALFNKLGIRPTKFIRTTDEGHKKVVRSILNRVHDSGDIYFGHYDGLYCLGCERYLTEKELIDGKCPDHGTEPEKRSESNWFFKMEKYRVWLRDYILEHEDFIQPEGFRKETLALLEQPIGDLSISRPKERVPWGIPIPWDENHVTYVWFDALINYVSGAGYPDSPDFGRYWAASHHLIAKDILKPHCVFWPCMLKAAGIDPYRAIRVHGYWLTDEGKMSKSRGNVVEPLDLVDKYGNDAFRYFLMREMSFGRDATFSELGLAERLNADLANDLGNLLNRTIGMVGRYFDGVLQTPDELNGPDKAVAAQVLALADGMRDAFGSMKINQGIEQVMEVVRATNKYIDSSKPWALAKDGNSRGRLGTVLYVCSETLRIVSVVLDAIMPGKMADLRTQLGIDRERSAARLETAEKWGLIKPGTKVEKGKPLFPRVDIKQLEASMAKGCDVPSPSVAGGHAGGKKEKGKNKEESGRFITFDEFMKVELVVARVASCEKVKKADKLLLVELDAGPRGKHTVLAGLAPWYEPSELLERRVLWVANLAPRKMRGLMSNGMLLAADTPDGGVRIVEPPSDAALGSRVH